MGEGVEMYNDVHCTYVCWQSGRVKGRRCYQLGSRKGQVGPVQQQELYRGRGGDGKEGVVVRPGQHLNGLIVLGFECKDDI